MFSVKKLNWKSSRILSLNIVIFFKSGNFWSYCPFHWTKFELLRVRALLELWNCKEKDERRNAAGIFGWNWHWNQERSLLLAFFGKFGHWEIGYNNLIQYFNFESGFTVSKWSIRTVVQALKLVFLENLQFRNREKSIFLVTSPLFGLSDLRRNVQDLSFNYRNLQ